MTDKRTIKKIAWRKPDYKRKKKEDQENDINWKEKERQETVEKDYQISKNMIILIKWPVEYFSYLASKSTLPQVDYLMSRNSPQAFYWVTVVQTD